MKTRIALVLLSGFATSVVAAERLTEQRDWTETFTVTSASPTLTVSNIWGPVFIRAGRDGEIAVSVKGAVSAPDAERLERALEIFAIDIEADDQGVALLVGEPRWEWQRRDPCKRCRAEYAFEISVPAGAIVDASTVNDGRVDILDVSGAVTASNVNGPIGIENVGDCNRIDNINGRIELSFSARPQADCDIETINGDVAVSIPGGAGLDLALNLYNGRIVSEFDVEPLPVPARVEATTDDEGKRYRIEQSAGVRIG
nr:hypothetical protein [Woeseiaceae bacterium]